MSSLGWFNAGEATLWFVIAATVFWRYGRGKHPRAKTARCAAVLLFLFGISDLIEIQTGAWWRPWWLLGLKSVCVVGLIACGVRSRFAANAERAADVADPNEDSP